MITNLITVANWYVGLLGNLFVIKRLWSIRIILLSLVSRICAMGALLLPMKIIILLGSGGKSSRFSFLPLDVLTINQLILGLIVLALLFYITHIISERFVNKYIERYSVLLLELSGKTSSYKLTNSTSGMAYGSAAESIGEFIFAALAITAVMFIYFDLAMLFSVFMIISVLSLVLLCSVNESINIRVSNDFKGTLSIMYGAGFICTFGFVVADFLLSINPPAMFSGLVGFILVRRIMKGLVKAISTINNLYQKRSKIDELFTQACSREIIHIKTNDVFWNLIDRSSRDQWLKVVIEDMSGELCDSVLSDWCQSGSAGVMAFSVSSLCGKGKIIKRYYVKLYNNDRTSKAISEAEILGACDLSLISLEYIGNTKVEGFHCHIFSLDDIEDSDTIDFSSSIYELQIYLNNFDLPEEFVSSYLRTHPILTNRIGGLVMDKLKMVALPGQVEQINRFELVSQSMMNLLLTLPKRLFFDVRSPDVIRRSKSGELKVLSFSDWRIDLMGVGLNGKILDQMQADEDIMCSLDNRGNAGSDKILLVSALYEFESNYNAEKYLDCINKLPLILDKFESISSAS